MKNIPLVRVRYADSFTKELNRIGAPTERLLNKVGLAEEMLSVPDVFMPVEHEFAKLTPTRCLVSSNNSCFFISICFLSPNMRNFVLSV